MVRAEAKAARRAMLLDVAKSLFAKHGFHGVRLEDLGAGAGISGPAVYRHFSSKEAVLTELLVGISEYLYAGGVELANDVQHPAQPVEVLAQLIDFHVDFAMREPELIVIQDRDFAALPEESRHRVRMLQRQYVTVWVTVMQGVHDQLSTEQATVRVHAAFGMINSTPYVARRNDPQVVKRELRTVARAALGATAPDDVGLGGATKAEQTL